MQFELQERHYARECRRAERSLIPIGSERVGRLIIDRRADEIRIVDITIMPEYRGHGIGSALIGDVLAESRATGKRVCLHVVSSNPACRLYERLGSVQVGATGAHLSLEWRPSPHR